MDLFEAMETCRAMRRFKPDPVPRETLERLVHYAICSPTAGNSQLWSFLMLTEPADKEFFGGLIQKVMVPQLPPDDVVDEAKGAGERRAFRHLIKNFHQVPAIILTCAMNGYPREEPNPLFVWSTVYPATQNLLLAARALGIGTCMTTFHMLAEPEIRKHFGIPDNVHIGATIPLGYPEGRFGPLTRKPVAKVTHWGRWGAAAS